MQTSDSKLTHDLRRLGVCVGDCLMVHASLRALGPIEGRAQGLMHSLLATLGDEGTLMAYVDFMPTDELPYFDPALSPANPECGVFAEILRTWPKAVRSRNPGASVAAIGARAEWLCRDHPMDYGYGPGSPFAKLVDLSGKVLLLGSDYDNVTLFHYAEHRAALLNKRIIRRTDRVLRDNTVVNVELEEFDTSEMIIPSMPSDYFARLTQQFVDAGHARTGMVAQAWSTLMPADVLSNFAIQSMERDFGQ